MPTQNIGNLTFTTRLIGLINRFDDTDGNGLSHVTDGESTQRWVLVVGLDTHGLGRNKFDNAGIARLDKLGGVLKRLATPTVNLLNELSELAGNVGSVTVEHRSVTSTNLTRMVEDDNLSIEGSSLLCWVILGVGSDVPATDIFDGDVPANKWVSRQSSQ